MNQKPSNHKFSDFFYNRVTYFGVGLSIIVLAVESLLFGIDFLTKGANIYQGILTYIILPPFLILGLLLIPLGAFWKRDRVYKGLEDRAPKKISIDLTIPQHRNAMVVFIIGSAIFIVMTAVGTYKAFNYTESVRFCGITCHKIMTPQYTAYLQSPHARVKCVECHIGEGADWYLRSKLSGARQVYHTIKGDYAKPIPTPVHNLRPAAETCEHCHWPGKFYNSFELRRTYYPTGETESKDWLLRMLIRVGGDREKGEGIHAHMYLDHDIFYAAEDESRQNITWVKSVDKDGKATIFKSPESKFYDQDPLPNQIRKMDCMDCHNRPTHRFGTPAELLDKAFTHGEIDSSIPEAKSKVMEFLSGEYASTEEAVLQIQNGIREYYQSAHPEFAASHSDAIEKLIARAVEMFKTNVFPEMKVRWDVYPNNIGHLWSPGCFRCHDGEHTSEEGTAITKDCNTCHTIIEQGPAQDLKSDAKGLEFVHPFDYDETWKEMNCYDCHTGN